MDFTPEQNKIKAIEAKIASLKAATWELREAESVLKKHGLEEAAQEAMWKANEICEEIERCRQDIAMVKAEIANLKKWERRTLVRQAEDAATAAYWGAIDNGSYEAHCPYPQAYLKQAFTRQFKAMEKAHGCLGCNPIRYAA